MHPIRKSKGARVIPSTPHPSIPLADASGTDFIPPLPQDQATLQAKLPPLLKGCLHRACQADKPNQGPVSPLFLQTSPAAVTT